MTAERTRDFESLYSSAHKIGFVAENLIVIPDSIVEIATDPLSSGPSAAQHLDVFLFSQHYTFNNQYPCSLGQNDHPLKISKSKLSSYWRGGKTFDWYRCPR
jgi:hypothetical protein